MRSSTLAASAALLSLASFTQAFPQFASSIAPSSATGIISQAPAPTGTIACNNSPELCNRSYNNITHMGAHDVAFLRDASTDFSQSGNTFYNATVALSAGIRLLQAQVHVEDGVPRLCHTSCLLIDGGVLGAWLSTIKLWMDENPNEVVTIILVNSDNLAAATFGAEFESSGLSTYGYTIPSRSATSEWPTLQTLITANTRLVTFIANIDYDPAYPYLNPEFDYVFETNFGVLSLDGFNCTLHRPSSQSSAASAISNGYMGMLNHFLDRDAGLGIQVPDVGNLTTTNSPSPSIVGALGRHGSECNIAWGVKPTFILVNFFNVGPAIETADLLNGITGTGRMALSTEQLTAATSGAPTPSGYGNVRVAAIAITVVAVGNIFWL